MEQNCNALTLPCYAILDFGFGVLLDLGAVTPRDRLGLAVAGQSGTAGNGPNSGEPARGLSTSAAFGARSRLRRACRGSTGYSTTRREPSRTLLFTGMPRQVRCR